MVTATKGLHRFRSRPYTQRPGFVPAVIALTVGWILVISWFVAAYMHYGQYAILGYFEFLVALGFAAFTALMTFTLIQEGNLTQEVIVDDENISLTTFDKGRKTKTTRSIAIREISRAEHYKNTDTGSIVLKGHTHDLEIPTWCFDHKADLMLVELLRAHNVEVLGVPRQMERELHHYSGV